MHSPSDCPFCHPKPQRIVAKSPLCLTLLDGFPVSNLTLDFCDFYLAPKTAGRLVGKTSACMAQVEEFSETDIQLLMLLMPSRKFIQRGFQDNAINLSLSGSACSSGGSPGSLRVSSVAGKTGRV